MNVTVYGVFEDVKYLCFSWLHHRSVASRNFLLTLQPNLQLHLKGKPAILLQLT